MQDMFVGQPFSVVNFARLSVTELIQQLATLNRKLPEADDRHRYDPKAKLVNDDPDSVPEDPPEDEPVYDVDPSQAPPPEPKQRKKKAAH